MTWRATAVVVVLMSGPALAGPKPEPTFPPMAGNLLLNGSFEHNVDDDLFPDHWGFLNYAPGGRIGWVQGGAFHGRVALRMSVPKNGQVIVKPGGISNNALPCVEGRSYVLSIYARTEGPARTIVQMGGHFADGTHRWEVCRGVIKADGPTAWKRYTWRFRGRKGIRTMHPWISHQQGTAVVDAWQVEEGTEPTPFAAPRFARLYVEPAGAQHVYVNPQGFTPRYTIHNQTGSAVRARIKAALSPVWGPGRWELNPLPVSLGAKQTATVTVTGAPKDLPLGRYKLSFVGHDAKGELCCRMEVEQTLAGPPNAPIPRVRQPEPPITAECQAVADGYSRLLVAMADVDETMRQIDRALFYSSQAKLSDPDRSATESVRASWRRAEAALTSARATYNQAYAMTFEKRRRPKRLTAEQRAQRDALLADAADKLRKLESAMPKLARAAHARLARLTESLATRMQPGFQPKVVGQPGRAQQDITMDSGARTNGIIWGIGGRLDNVLRVQRWFGFGSKTGRRPGMRAPGKLAQGAQTWFNTREYRSYQRAGIKYDTNFYIAGGSMRSAAATAYFIDAHKDDADIFLQTSTGQVVDRRALNVWHPAVRAHVRDFCTTQARLLRDDPRAMFHYYAWEPSFALNATREQGGRETGYNRSAKRDFRRWLCKKFGTIAKLNRAWGARYASFDAIEPPPDGMLVTRKQATPLTYEFELWRRASYADWYRLCYEAIKAGDPSRPVGISGEGSASFFNSCCYSCGIDYWQLAKKGMDFVETHSELYLKLPDIIWEHSLARLLDKPQLLNESNWDWAAPTHKLDERQWQAVGEISLWEWMVWGRTYMNIYSAESGYVPPTKFYGQALLEMKQDYTVLRECAKFMRIAMRKSDRYGDILLGTRVATPKLAVLQPSTAIINCYPAGAHRGGYPHHPPRQEAFHFAALNTPRNYDHLYVPEEAVIEDGHKLGQYRAVLLPYATHFPPGLCEALVAYVESGGWLICSGPPGVYDHYGRYDNRLLGTVLGPCRPGYVSGNENTWVWALDLKGKRDGVTVELADKQGRPAIVAARHSKGGLVVTTAGWRTDQAKEVYYRLLDRAVGHRTAWCDHDRFEFVTRVDGRGRRYLFALNRSVDDTVEDLVHVEGTYRQPVDLGIGKRFPLPATTRDGTTTFRLRLERGDATVIALR